MIDPVTGQGTQMGGIFNPNGPFGPGGNIGGGVPQDLTPEQISAMNPDIKIGFGEDFNIPGYQPPGGNSPGMGGKGGLDQISAMNPGMTMPAPGATSPGMGGKGPLSQIPVDMNGQVLGTGQGMFSPGSMGQQVTDQQANIPQPPAAPPAAVAQGGTPGRPVPAMPFTPRGPGYANPGASGVARSMQGAQQQMSAPQGILTNPQGQRQPLTGNFQPSGMQTRLQPARPVAPAPINRPLTGNFQPQRRGAGRGGMLR